MAQKYGSMANGAPNASGFTCLICETSPVSWTWSDAHGEAMCTKGGTPYQLIQRDEDKNIIDALPSINITEKWVPVLKQYWQETQRFTGLGTIMIWRDYPECDAGQEAFYRWVDEHPAVVPAS